MQLKNSLLIVLTSLVLTGLTSCLGNNDDYIDPTVSTDAQLVTFGISSDSLKTLASVVFSIDQEKSEIYNNDSLPYLTNLDTIAKVKLSFTTGLGLAYSVRVEYPENVNDTVWVATGDSIKPINLLKLKVYAQDSKITKTYTVHFNVHQIDPDSVQYHPINYSEIPTSTAPDYNALTNQFPNTVAVLGFLHPGTQKGLAFVVAQEGKNYFAYSEDLTTYTPGDTVPQNFPLTGFSRLNSTEFGRPPLTVIENLQSVWATEDGKYWINLVNTQADLPVIEGGNAFAYNGEIWFILGKIKDSEYNEKVYYSKNGGVVWNIKPEKTQVPASFQLRKNATVTVDAEGKYFYISGGNNGSVASSIDFWQAVLNSRLFAD